MVFTIDNEFRSLIPPLTDEEYAGLEQSIVEEGCRDALITWNGILIDGHNRYEICTKHNIDFETREFYFTDRDEVKLWMMKNQLARRNLNDFQRIEITHKCEDAVRAKAKERQSKYYGNQYDGLMEKFPEVQTSTARDELGAMAGVSGKTYEHAVKVLNTAPQETLDALRRGEISINKAFQEIQRAEREAARETARQENAAKIEELATPLEAQGLFQTIVIDPPWDWGDEGDINQFGRAKPDYHTMPIEEIEKLPVGQIADENCHLYLWVTNRSLPKAFRLIEAWGFRYITCLTWVKPSIGMGNYFRGSTEQVLFCVKGSQMLKRRDVGTHFEAPRGQGHSAKPDEFYRLVESCSYAPYIDIFGRKGRDGWSVWGENG